jgi:hypothetical protein
MQCILVVLYLRVTLAKTKDPIDAPNAGLVCTLLRLRFSNCEPLINHCTLTTIVPEPDGIYRHEKLALSPGVDTWE